MSFITGRFLRLCQEAEPKHFVLPLRSRKTDHVVVQFFPPLQVGSTSSQSRASRNARLCQSVFRCTPHRQPQTRRAESLRCTPLPVYVGPRRSGQSLLTQRLPSAGPTRMPEQKNVTAATRLSVQVPGQGRTTPGRNQAGNLPRPTALPPMPFVSGYSHG